MMPVCYACGSDKLAPSTKQKTVRSRRCARCINQSPAGKAARARWIRKRRQTAEGKRTTQRINARRIFVGQEYYGTTATEQAATINAHIRRRLSVFKSRQSSGT